MKSKYMGMKSGKWTCTHVGVAKVTPAFKKVEGKRVRCSSAGHRQYYYIWERLTSDGKAMKMIRLTAAQVLKVRKGLLEVEAVARQKKQQLFPAFTDKVSYSFCD